MLEQDVFKATLLFVEADDNYPPELLEQRLELEDALVTRFAPCVQMAVEKIRKDLKRKGSVREDMYH